MIVFNDSLSTWWAVQLEDWQWELEPPETPLAEVLEDLLQALQVDDLPAVDAEAPQLPWPAPKPAPTPAPAAAPRSPSPPPAPMPATPPAGRWVQVGTHTYRGVTAIADPLVIFGRELERHDSAELEHERVRRAQRVRRPPFTRNPP